MSNAKGFYVKVARNAKAVIYAGEHADMSTFILENFHAFILWKFSLFSGLIAPLQEHYKLYKVYNAIFLDRKNIWL